MLFLYHCLCNVNQCLILKTIIDVESCIALIAHLSSEFLWIKGCWNKLCCLTGLGPGEPWPGTVMALHIPVVGFPGRSIDEAWVQARSYFQVCPWHPTLPDLAPAVWKKTDIPRSTLPNKPHFISLSLPPPSTPFFDFPQKSSQFG